MSRVVDVTKTNKDISINKTWSTKIFDCCDDDCSMFIFGVVCANTSIAQMFERVGKPGYCLILTIFTWTLFTLSLTIPIYVYYDPNFWGVLWGSLSLSFFVILTIGLVFYVRYRLRVKNKIKGNLEDDACTSFWCCLCAHMQHMREEKLSAENYNLTSTNAV